MLNSTLGRQINFYEIIVDNFGISKTYSVCRSKRNEVKSKNLPTQKKEDPSTLCLGGLVGITFL
jgi:hypothetical protein